MADRARPVQARVDEDLYDAARIAAGLPESASQGQVVRYALAALAGRDLDTETYRQPGWTGRRARQAAAATA